MHRIPEKGDRRRVSVGLTALAVLMAWGPLAAAADAPERRYVRTREGRQPQPIVAVDNVCAWPNLTVLRDGSIAAVIFNQPSHGGMAGDVDCWATTDGGRTWEKRGTPAPHEPETTRMNVAAGLAGNGDLIVISSGWSNRYPEGQKGPTLRAGVLDPWVCRSADGGRTWVVDRTSFPAKAPDGGACIPFGDILAAQDGSLCVAIYTYVAEKPRRDRVFVYRSRDDGKTWAEPAAMDDANLRNETALLHLGAGKWLAAARSSELTLYRSEDDARTWQMVGPVTGRSMHPGHFVRLRDGRLLLTYGNRTQQRGVEIRFGDPQGMQWTQPRVVADFETDGGYPSSVQLPDGQVLTVFYAKKTPYHDRYHMGAAVWDPARSE